MDTIYIPISSIQSNPRQPRTEFNAVEMAGLVASVKEHGILQALMVTPGKDGIYVLIAGERRLRAAREAGLEEVPATVILEVDEQDQLELALIENVQRADLNPLEKARAYQQLVDEFGLTHDQVAERVGQHRATVTNALRLLRLPEAIQINLLNDLISERQASALLGMYDLPEPLLKKAEEYTYDPSLKPSNIESKVKGGTSSDYVRDTINRMLLAFGKRIIWGLDTVFAVPAEMPALCADCPNLIKRSNENLCGDENCFHIRLNAFHKQSLPLPEPTPAPAAAPLPRAATPVAETIQEEGEEPGPGEDAPQAEQVVGYSTVADVEPETVETPDIASPAPEPPPVLVAAPPAAAPDWEHATLLITLQYMPQDGNPDGRPVSIGLRANNGMPAFRMCREKDTLLPGYLSGLLLDMETKFKEG